jgi:DNA-binding IclR family transcriptional regulator
LHNTSLGKCFLAYDEVLLNNIIHKELIKKTPYTITDSAMLLDEVNKVRKQGYAVDNREQDERMLCIGAPIFGQNNNIIAAISVSGLYNENINIEYEANIVKEKAYIISKKMGYTENNITGLKYNK